MRTATPSPLRTSRHFDRGLALLLRRLGITPPRRSGFAVMQAGTPGPSPRIRRVQAFVERNVGDALRLDDLAEVAGLSRYHFARTFREEVGMTPWAFVREARVRRATALLRAGRTPAEAAHAAGFADQSHLTRTLRALDGRTPGAIRRTAEDDRQSDRMDDRQSDRADDRKIVQDP